MTFRKPAFALAACAALTAMTPALAGEPTYEENWARQQQAQIFTAPIAGVYNRFWFDYRTNVNEAEEELYSDLRRASDIEDQRDAWEEYGSELVSEREHYIEEMAERGYRAFTITVE